MLQEDGIESTCLRFAQRVTRKDGYFDRPERSPPWARRLLYVPGKRDRGSGFGRIEAGSFKLNCNAALPARNALAHRSSQGG